MVTTENHVFFWNGIYSQWHKATMVIDGIEYNCCEQYMMHQKALTFGDQAIAEMVLQNKNPRDQKALGRQINGFDKDKWDSVCLGIVYKGNLEKFRQNPDLLAELLSTGDRLLVEASPFDKIWGIGMAEDDPGVDDPANWKGLNLLGWSITLVKQQLKNS
jgi:ribA/ribD-fused uncharacterized protein